MGVTHKYATNKTAARAILPTGPYSKNVRVGTAPATATPWAQLDRPGL